MCTCCNLDYKHVTNNVCMHAVTWLHAACYNSIQVSVLTCAFDLSFLSILMGVDGLAELSSTGTEQYTSTSRQKSGPTISGLSKKEINGTGA